ncbi:MAG: ATP-binding cassette domain-containing protein [Candidatus Sulfotelmatobacter sp.]
MLPSMDKDKTVNPALHAQVRKRITAASGFVLDVDFHAAPGFTILFGASGAGKTTLLDCIAGLIEPDSGRISIGEDALFDAAAHIDLPVEKRNIGYVFQDLALFPHLTVEENVEYGLLRLPSAERSRRSAAILATFRVAHLARSHPSEISGGERQRIALARALVTDPVVLLLDEPLVGLDAATKSRIIDDLRAWNEAHRIPILYVTHSREEVFALGESVLVLDHGRILAEGTPHEVLSAPRQETVAHLAGFENILDATVESLNADRGTMTCLLQQGEARNAEGRKLIQRERVALETPLVRAELGSSLRVGIRAGDILLAIIPPVGLSARNVIPGSVLSLERRDVMISARVNCGVELEVHLTLAARESLRLEPGREVWLVIKTYSCHLMHK